MGTVVKRIPPPPPKLELILATITAVISAILAVLLLRNVIKQDIQTKDLDQKIQTENF